MLTTKERLLEIIKEEVEDHIFEQSHMKKPAGYTDEQWAARLAKIKNRQAKKDSSFTDKLTQAKTSFIDYLTNDEEEITSKSDLEAVHDKPDDISGTGHGLRAAVGGFEIGTVTAAYMASNLPKFAASIGRVGRLLLGVGTGGVGLAVLIAAELAFFYAIDSYIKKNYPDNPNKRNMLIKKVVVNAMNMARKIRKHVRSLEKENFKNTKKQDLYKTISTIQKAVNSFSQALRTSPTESKIVVDHFMSIIPILQRGLKAKGVNVDSKSKQTVKSVDIDSKSKQPVKAKKTKTKASKRKSPKSSKSSKSNLRKELRAAWREMTKAAKDEGKSSWSKLPTSHPTRVKVRQIYKQLKA